MSNCQIIKREDEKILIIQYQEKERKEGEREERKEGERGQERGRKKGRSRGRERRREAKREVDGRRERS